MTNNWLTNLVVVVFATLLPAVASAAALDDYYLARFAKVYGKGRQTVATASLPATPSEGRCLTPLYHDLKRDWKALEPATQQVLATYLDKPSDNWAAGHVFAFDSPHFTIHYTNTGADAVTDLNWVKTVATTFEAVYSTETGASPGMGYRAPPTSNTGKVDVYLQDLAATSQYGLTTSDSPASSPATPYAYTSYIIIDKAFTAPVYTQPVNNVPTFTPLQSLQVTAAHEFHHTVQYGYSFYFDIWYAEATSTWMEDEVYDGVNQLYSYLSAYFFFSGKSIDIAPDVTSGGGYGRWLFNRYLAEHYLTRDVIRSFWERLAAMTPPSNGADIPAVSVLAQTVAQQPYGGSLANDFLGFAKRVYTRDWSTTHTSSEIGLIPAAVPFATYSTYPANGAPLPAPVSAQSPLAPLSFAYFRYLPSAGAPLNLVLQVNNQPSGVVAVAFRKDNNGAIAEFTAAGDGTITISGFNAPTTAEVYLLLCNTNLPTTSTTTQAASGGGGGGGGCFIATAAYGSYLHPKVRVLRAFRDRYLLTNAPGRLLVACYYKASPGLAAFIAKHSLLRALCRLLLTPVVWMVEYMKTTLVTVLLGAIVWWSVAAARQRRDEGGNTLRG
ncbi:MAG TPA: MXAN_6640 family putative metalloprotease [Geobacteraceae bacterium]